MKLLRQCQEIYQEHFQNGAVPQEGRYDHHFQNHIILSIDQQEARRCASQIDDGDIPGVGHSKVGTSPKAPQQLPFSHSPTPTLTMNSRRSWDLLLAKGTDPREWWDIGTRKRQIPMNCTTAATWIYFCIVALPSINILPWINICTIPPLCCVTVIIGCSTTCHLVAEDSAFPQHRFGHTPSTSTLRITFKVDFPRLFCIE